MTPLLAGSTMGCPTAFSRILNRVASCQTKLSRSLAARGPSALDSPAAGAPRGIRSYSATDPRTWTSRSTALRRGWCWWGEQVLIGSRYQDKADEALKDIEAVMAERGQGNLRVRAMENLAAASTADIVVLTVPFAHHKSTLETIRPALEGKILIDVTVPLMPPKVGTVQLPPEGSAGAAAQQLLGEGVMVVSAFQNVAAHHL